MPAAADADAEAAEDAAAAGLAGGALDDEVGTAGGDEDDDELHAASKIAAPDTMTAIATWLRRI